MTAEMFCSVFEKVEHDERRKKKSGSLNYFHLCAYTRTTKWIKIVKNP